MFRNGESLSTGMLENLSQCVISFRDHRLSFRGPTLNEVGRWPLPSHFVMVDLAIPNKSESSWIPIRPALKVLHFNGLGAVCFAMCKILLVKRWTSHLNPF